MPFSQKNPFYPSEGAGLAYNKFSGRLEFRREFSHLVGWLENGQRCERKDPPHRAWVIEGARGYGKSAFASWCEKFPGKVENVGNELIVIKIKAPQSVSKDKDSAFVEILKDIEACLWKSLHSRRVTWNSNWGWLRLWDKKVRTTAHKLMNRKKIYNYIATTLSKGKFDAPSQVEFNATPIIEAIRDSAADLEELKTIVIMIDDLGEHQQDLASLSPLEQDIVGFVNRFVETSYRNDFSIVIILLTYPGFVDRIPSGKSFNRRSATISVKSLEPFSLPDTEALTSAALREAGVEDADVIRAWGEWIHAASGGIPDLVQAIGHEAYNNELGVDSLTPDAVVKAANNPNDTLFGKLKAQLEIRGVRSGDFQEKEISLMQCLANIPMQRMMSVRMTEKDWKTLLQDKSSSVTKSTIDKFWDKLVDHNIVSYDDDDGAGKPLFSFFAEAIRINLYKIVKCK